MAIGRIDMTAANISSADDRAQRIAGKTETRNTGQFTTTHRPPKVYFDATPCEGPGCTNTLPAGYCAPQRSRSFCSKKCLNRDAATKYHIGTCLHCGGPIMGRKDKAAEKKFCCNAHKLTFDTERVLSPTGPFRPLVEEYVGSAAGNMYRPGTLPNVRVSLGKFFRFVNQNERISDLEEIGPSVITRFIAHERERGLTGRNFVGHLSTFFGWLMGEERLKRPNPVIPRIHSQRGAPAEARPYTDLDLNTIWKCVERTGRLELMLAFAIGEETGLRIGEVCNLRLSDIDKQAQSIFVRLPTKNMKTRYVPYSEKVRRYLGLWLAKRDPRCIDDYLFHNKAFRHYDTSKFDAWFKKNMKGESEPARSFLFHRLRHSWATRLMNNGMELAVLKELGGWVSWNSMQRYIRVLPATVRSQYEASYARLQEKAESGEDEELSLVDFAHMDAAQPASQTTTIV
jgi:integrase